MGGKIEKAEIFTFFIYTAPNQAIKFTGKMYSIKSGELEKE